MRLFKIRPGRLDAGPVPPPAEVSHACDVVPVPLTTEQYLDLHGLPAPEDGASLYAVTVADRAAAALA